MLSVRPDRPIDRLTVAVMREVNVVLRELGLSHFLCGAMARDVLLTHVYGIETGIATLDVDFGVAVESWEQFENIKNRLIATGKFESAQKMAHRLSYKHKEGSTGYPLDIIPFGGVEKPPNSVAWPPDMDEVLNVIAYKEALANSIEVRIDNDLVAPVISLPGLTLLKLFAWVDRGAGNPKDARDLGIMMRTYHEAGNQDRLYGEEIKVLEEVEFDVNAASPHLLGKDVRSIAAAETLEQALTVLNNPQLFDRLTAHMAPGFRAADDPIEAAIVLLGRFKAGLTGE